MIDITSCQRSDTPGIRKSNVEVGTGLLQGSQQTGIDGGNHLTCNSKVLVGSLICKEQLGICKQLLQ